MEGKGLSPAQVRRINWRHKLYAGWSHLRDGIRTKTVRNSWIEAGKNDHQNRKELWLWLCRPWKNGLDILRKTSRTLKGAADPWSQNGNTNYNEVYQYSTDWILKTLLWEFSRQWTLIVKRLKLVQQCLPRDYQCNIWCVHHRNFFQHHDAVGPAGRVWQQTPGSGPGV